MARKEVRLLDVERFAIPLVPAYKVRSLTDYGGFYLFGLWLFPPLSFPVRTGVLYSWGICAHHQLSNALFMKGKSFTKVSA